MTTTTAPERTAPLDWADAHTLREVRPAVRDLLLSSEAFTQLTPDEQRKLAAEMVKVSSYMADPDGLGPEVVTPPGEPVAEAQAQPDATEATRQRLSKDPGFAGEDFKAGAVNAGVEAFGAMVQKVDFPKFVSGLIQGVFQAIVDSSIQQMRAYGELLANVAKTVDQYAKDNISPNNARDWLVNRFPDKLDLNMGGEDAEFAEGEAPPEAAAAQPKVKVKEDVDIQAALAEISKELDLARPLSDISEEAQEGELVRQAQLQIARGRQQLLASMVVLGINRIVVTDGLINAKVVFDMRASDQAKRRARASMTDKAEQHAKSSVDVGYGSWLSPWDINSHNEASADHVATVQSSVDDNSESKAEVKAKLSGEVRVNFKSDYFPMEKLANPQMIAAIQGNSVPPGKPVQGA